MNHRLLKAGARTLALAALCFVVSAPAALAADSLRIGSLPAADSVILHAAVRDGVFAKHGFEVEVVPFQSAIELGAAMRAGTLDGHFGDIINVLLQNESGAPQTIVATTSHSAPGSRFFGLCVGPKSEAKSAADLRGRTCAIGRATIVEFVLDRLLAGAGHEGAAEKQDIRQIPVRLQLLLSGQTESALLPEPLVSLVEAKGARVLLDDRGLGLPLAVIALRKTGRNGGALDAALIRRFRAALAEEAGHINAAPEACRQLMLELRLLPKPAAGAYAMLRFDGSTTPLGLPTEADIAAYADWMRQAGMLKKGLPAIADIVFREAD